MNILFVSSKVGWGGIMTFMIQSAEGLEQRNNKVWIISNPKSRLTKKNYPNLNIVEKSFGPDYNPILILWLAKFIKQNEIDVIISNIKKEVIVSGFAAKLTGIKHIRSLGSHEDLNPRVKKYHDKLIHHSIIPCEYVFKKAAETEHWLDEKDFTVIYVGRNPIKFSVDEINKIRKLWGILDNEIVIGITAKLSPIKNIAGIIKAFKILSKDQNNLKLIITGFGEEKENLKSLSTELNLNSKIVFNDFTNNPEQTASCYDIAILNSFSEGFPNSIVEYMSVGTPTISSDVGGINEIIENNFNGILVPSNNEKILAEKISFLISDNNMRDNLSKNSLKTIKEKFSKDKMITDLENLFHKVIKHV
jgi:glycosyltransferase involved in cell wall biosynthesis